MPHAITYTHCLLSVLQAARYYRRAASLGHLLATFNLALMMLNGDGVTKEGVKAVDMLSEVAGRGLVEVDAHSLPYSCFTFCLVF